LRIENLPFHIGATSQPVNPGCLPSCYPFELDFDPHLRRLLQPANPELERVLRDAYEIGQAFGTPLAENQFGRPYAEDFLSFIHTAGLDPACGLEIGAGVGYLTRRLLDEG
jgi:hypothetical protein